MMRSAPLTRSKMALSFGPCSNGARIISTSSVSARQASGENRSRITDAADCAAPTRNGSAPVSSRCCSTAAATSAGRTFSMSSGTASQAPSSATMSALTSRSLWRALGRAVDQRPHQAQRRLGALDIAAEPEQVGGGAARQRAGRAIDGDPVRRRQQRGRRDRLVRQDPGIAGPPALLQIDGARIEIVGDAHEAARHHPPAVAARAPAAAAG